jgi:hypothetical protein
MERSMTSAPQPAPVRNFFAIFLQIVCGFTGGLPEFQFSLGCAWYAAFCGRHNKFAYCHSHNGSGVPEGVEINSGVIAESARLDESYTPIPPNHFLSNWKAQDER